MKKTLTGIVAASLLMLAGSAAFADDDYKIGALKVEDTWARATPGQAPNGAVFLKVENKGDAADQLTGAASPAAAKVELHQHVMDGGVMKMGPVAAIEIPAKGEAKLAPGGYHVMLLGLKEPLKAGDTIPLTLTFAKAGSVTVKAEVKAVGAKGHDHD